ncbi:MAG: hypothetical protein ACLVHU_00305 [Bifidobacterium adolescentis]|jgi:hypothetical protein
MRIYIVHADIDDRGCVPYYGSFVSVMGVYTTREQAVKHARNLKRRKFALKHKEHHGDKGVYIEEFELNSNCQKFIGGYSE